MKKVINYLLLVIVVAAVAGGSSYLASKAAAVKHHEQTMSEEVSNARRWLHEADLTAEQLEKLDPVETALKRDLDSLQIVLAKERLLICSMFKDTKPTAEQLQSHVQRIGQLESAKQDLIVKHLIAMSEILTFEQKDKFFSAMMTDICTGCRHGYCKPGTPCMCGQCNMGKSGEHNRGV